MKAFIFIVVVALLGWWAYRHNYIKPEWVGLGSAPSLPQGKADSLHEALNRGLPRMASNELSLDRAVANNLNVIFDYRLVDLDQYAVAQKYGTTLPPDMQALLIRDLCGIRAVREQVLAQGREAQVQVRSQDNRPMYTTQLKPGAC